MEQPEEIDVSTNASAGGNKSPAPAVSAARLAVSALAPQSCPTCGGVPGTKGGVAAPPSYVYAIGRIEPRFPRISVEKELIQVTGRADTSGLSDRQALQRVLSERQHRYLARQLCWVLTVEGLETYLLYPRDLADLDLLIEAVRATPSPMDLDVVIGTRGPIAPPELCNGLMVPIVAFEQIYSFDRDALIKNIPRPEKTPEEEFAPAAADLFDRIMQLTDNAGGTDEHRALNYLAVRYPAVYANAAEAFGRNSSLTAVETRSSPLSGTRKIVEVIFAYTNRNTDVAEKFFVRVDVTEEFPFLVTKLSPYYDR
jgi:PatG C-terminal